MDLDTALQETGCAVSFDQQVVISVEKLPGRLYLLMHRRGVVIIVCTIVDGSYLRRHYAERVWRPARHRFVVIHQQID